MDSAKKTKLFPDFSNLAAYEERSTSREDESFQMSGTIWESLLREPSFESQLKDWIHKIAADRVATRTEELENQIREKAHREGFEAGLQEGSKAIEAALGALHDISQQVVANKTALITEHEQFFSETLISVLEDLAVPRARHLIEQIEGLLNRFKAEFTDKGRVEVSVSPATWSELQAGGMKSLEGLRWVIQVDDTLQPGDLRLDMGGVGLELIPSRLIEQWRVSLESEVKKTG